MTDSQLTTSMNKTVEAEHVSTSAIVVDDVMYLQGCNTRFGEFPYCQQMRHGAFSVTKSMGAAVALLRLAEKYGDAVLDENIIDHVQLNASHNGWQDVTFLDVLNMATGIGDNAPLDETNVFADENGDKMGQWSRGNTKQEKLDISATYGDLPWLPGETFRYNTTHTYVLAVAMDNFLKSKEGTQANLWDMVAEEVYAPIGISHMPHLHTLEADGSRGVPIMGIGLYPTAMDVAKITRLLQNSGEHAGTQLLSKSLTEQAMYRTEEMGLPSHTDNNEYGQSRYLMSFWSTPIEDQSCFAQIPHMNGFGGNLVSILPNGVSVFRFADQHQYATRFMIEAALKVRPLCSE